MNYEIEQVSISYQNGIVEEIRVLWRDGSHYRAAFMNRKEVFGNKYLQGEVSLNDALLQEVAGYGMCLDSLRKKRFFPEVKKWSE